MAYLDRTGGLWLIVGIPVMRETLAYIFRRTAWPRNPLRTAAKAGAFAPKTPEKIVYGNRLTPTASQHIPRAGAIQRAGFVVRMSRIHRHARILAPVFRA